MQTLNKVAAHHHPAFLGALTSHITPNEALFHVLPVPLPVPLAPSSNSESSTVYTPSNVLRASEQLETWDGQSDPSRLGIFTHAPIDCRSKIQGTIEQIASASKAVHQRNKVTVLIGGARNIIHGAVKGLFDSPIKDIGVVHVDSQACLRDRCKGTSLHPNCVMKRILDMKIPIFQLGIRALSEEEESTRKRLGIPHIDGQEAVTRHMTDVPLRATFPSNIFIALDVSGLDPTVFPETEKPVPGGLAWYQTLDLITSICMQRNVVGFAVAGLKQRANEQASNFTAALLCYQIMGLIERSR